ncbi:MAG TPA: DUF3592 domain-containing protein [Thermoanaerobaculia bacterium]|nr:DUF3592 domain-containing protein [Thermoanaerobaculia bacterium]
MILEIAGLSLLLFVAVFLLVPMFRSSGRQALQKQWPRVRGEVTAQRVRMSGNTGFPEYRVRYDIDGRAYEEYAGSADGVGHTHYDIEYDVRKAVDAKMARRPVGSHIEIRVNPANHAEVHLVERELPARTLAYVATAIFLLFFLLFAALAFGWI